MVKGASNLYSNNAICHRYNDSATTKIDAMQIQMHLYWKAKSNQFHDTSKMIEFDRILSLGDIYMLGRYKLFNARAR